MKPLTTIALVFSLLMTSAGVPADLPSKKVLSLHAAKQIAAAAESEAKRRGATVVIAIVDDGGHLLLLERLDSTQVASAEVAIGKARTAAIFRRPSKVFEDQIREGRIAALALPGATPLQGGLPLVHERAVIGAIGVSGSTPQEDEEIAKVGADSLSGAITEAHAPVTYFPAEQVTATFAKGVPLLEVKGYKVHASRRTEPGVVEVHEWDTDVIYVLEGSATFVTGGKLVDSKTIAPGEIRGQTVEGGESRRIAKGDVIIVPNGTPHWFKEVQGPLLYFVVKPVSGGDL
jgi:Uncharacterized protein, possibly involved in utilization of glycolate and propanediol